MNLRLLTAMAFVSPSFLISAYGAELQVNSHLTLEVGDWSKDGPVFWSAPPSTKGVDQWTLQNGGAEIKIQSRRVGKLTEWEVSANNGGSSDRRLQLRWRLLSGEVNGDFWDGLTLNRAVSDDVAAVGKRYAFPLCSYDTAGRISLLGYAPQTISSRFESGCHVVNGHAFLEWNSYLALSPGQRDVQFFVSASLPATDNFTEAVEQYYLSYPHFFRPGAHSDPRLFGEGGYSWGPSYSSPATGSYQLEEARRVGFSWEWVYAPFQKVGDIWPSPKYWEDSLGFNIQAPEASKGTPASIEDWQKSYNETITRSNRAAGMLYYYLPQYADAKIVTDNPDSIWKKPDGTIEQPLFGWIKRDENVRPAWPGHTSHGDKTRADLAQIWSHFPVSGFAMDMTVGDFPYAGDALPKETGKAFDEQGRVFVNEGVALASLMDYTRSLPPHADGRRAAAIANESVTYLPIFHADSLMHEKPPYDSTNVAVARRLMAGQKPLNWWTGYKVEDMLDHERLTPAEFREGLSGMEDYVILSSLRYGGMPSIFFVQGYPEIRSWLPILVELEKAGWRAASYVRIEGPGAPDSKNPFDEDAGVWVSRYGDSKKSYLTFSAPDKSGFKGKAVIESSRYGAAGGVYLDWDGKKTVETVAPEQTELTLELKDRKPQVFVKTATLRADKAVAFTVERTIAPSQKILIVFTPSTTWPEHTSILRAGETEWRKIPAGNKPFTLEESPSRYVLPDSNWLSRVEFGTPTESEAVIVVSEQDRAKLEPALSHLQAYWEYYQVRQAQPGAALSDLALKPELQLPIVSDFASPEVQRAKTVFLLGHAGQNQINANSSDVHEVVWSGQMQKGKLCIAFRGKGDDGEAAQIMSFLDAMDQRFPHVGVLDTTPWFVKEGMAGHEFHQDSP